MKVGIDLNCEQEGKFASYMERLIESNKKFNLTAITDPEEIAVKHFVDSVMGERFIPKSAKVADVGSGAGFPAIPIAIMRPDLKFTLIDSLLKRVNFLTETTKLLDVNAECLHLRAEDAGRGELREQFDCVVARAVAPLSALCEYTLPLVKVGGIFLAYKGAESGEEVKGAQNALNVLGGKVKIKEEFTLPDGSGRSVVVIEKAFPTPKKYPRGQNKPRLAPL